MSTAEALPEYTKEELCSIYELGRLYFEMGYLTPAERIFAGLAAVDRGQTCARLGLGLVKMERGLYEEAITQLREALNKSAWEIQVKLALSAAFRASGERQRAESILAEVARALDGGAPVEPEVRKLFEAFALIARR